MRGDKVFRVYGVHAGREKDSYFGAFRTVAEANAKISDLNATEMHSRKWASQYHDRGFVIREVLVDTDFEFPSRPKPRDKYCVKVTSSKNVDGTFNSSIVDVYRREAKSTVLEKICTYSRNLGIYETFEPFRQGGREYALVSCEYTRTAVLDLLSGTVIAEEAETVPRGSGFCPVGFYVPDWWDVNDDSMIPGSEYWTADNEWPDGSFGFVWGCIWGDDSSWKVQHLDLSRIRDGIITRDERFGYLELATSRYRSPSLTLETPESAGSATPAFIEISKYNTAKVCFAVAMEFNLVSGKSAEWERLKIANLE